MARSAIHEALYYPVFSAFKLNDLYSSPNIIQVVKLRRIGWAGHVAWLGEDRGAYRIFGGET
jgi:hypothetical protein